MSGVLVRVLLVVRRCRCRRPEGQRQVSLLLPAMAEGVGWVGAGVLVGVVAAMMSEEEGGGCGSWQKKEREELS